MTDIRIVVDADRALQACLRAPEVMARHMSEGTAQGAHLVARGAKRNVRSVFGTLAQSIRVEALSGLPDGQIGHEAAAGTAYAPYVEEGTGPAAGRPRYYPNPDALMDFLAASPKARGFKWAATGSFVRTTQKLELFNRARALAWAICQRGTKPAPYMRTAAAESDEAVRSVLRAAVQRGTEEAFRA